MLKNRIPLILLLNIAGLALFFSWYLPVNHGFWSPLDNTIFHFFNQGVGKNHTYALVLALINNRAFDACSLLAMGSLMLSFWLKGQHAERRRIFLIGLVMLLSAVIINQLAQHLMPVDRASPTLWFSGIVRVSDVVSLPTKDASGDSFPGDHGMMLLVYAAFMWRYFGFRAFVIALAIFVIFAFPRIMIGAHWFSDVAVGSLAAILIGAPWILLTPVSDKVITWLNNFIPHRIGNFPI